MTRTATPAHRGPDSVAISPGDPSWWEDLFLHHWEAQQGGARTAHLMDRLIAGLRDQVREFAFLEGRPLDVLDWGCAFGEGTQRLANALRQAAVTGLDVAEEAVRVARRRHPGIHFLRTDAGLIPRAFDVIVAADRLSHVADLAETIRGQLGSCRWLYVAFVPEDAEPPATLGGFTRLCAEPVAIDPSFGASPRRLVVYGSPAYLAAQGISVPPASSSETGRDGALAASPQGDSRLARALAESVARLAEREAYWASRLETLRAEQDRRTAAQAQREAELASHEAVLVARLDERARLINGLTAHISGLTAMNEQDRIALEQAVLDLGAQLAASQDRIAELERASEVQAAELAAMTSGRAWKFARLASAARRKLAPRAILPIPSRRPDRQAG